MKTAVEWLEEQYNLGNGFERLLNKKEFEQAKEMEKQQIINAVEWNYKSNMGEVYYKSIFKIK